MRRARTGDDVASGEHSGVGVEVGDHATGQAGVGRDEVAEDVGDGGQGQGGGDHFDQVLVAHLLEGLTDLRTGGEEEGWREREREGERWSG